MRKNIKTVCALFIILFLLCTCLTASASDFVVVIDPGHGGKDGGAVRGSYKEKEINLKVALALGQMIEQNYSDVKVVYTRKKDVFVDLDKRAAIANKAKANLFISIHTNSTSSKVTTASGADTYILGLTRSAENLAVAKRENSVILLEDDYSTKYQGFDPNSPESYIIFEFMTNKYMEQSLQFASFVQRDFKLSANRIDRGVRQAGFLVLRQTSMPSVLIELGFINNPKEAKFLYSQSGQRSMASAIFSGFRKFKYDFDKKQGKYTVPAHQQGINRVAKNGNAGLENTDDSLYTVDSEVPTVHARHDTAIAHTPETTEAKESTTAQIEYRVQFLVSTKILPKNSSQFKGLSPVSYYKDARGYKYTFGSTTDQNEILRIQKQVRSKFKDAFIVKFRNGERIK